MDLLNFGVGTLPYHYFYFCLAACVGVLQMFAARYNRRSLLWFSPTYSFVFGGLLMVGSFVWFFSIQDDLFIPGLAGGELAVEFLGAFLLAGIGTRILAVIRARFHPNLRPITQTYLAKVFSVSRDPAGDL